MFNKLDSEMSHHDYRWLSDLLKPVDLDTNTLHGLHHEAQ